MNRRVVIGGGPAGVTAAWRLSQQGERVTLIEQAPAVGGISRTFRRDDCLLEYGPHAFHIKEPYITDLVQDICGDDFRIIPTKTNIILKGEYFRYPLEFYDVIRHLNPALSARMVLDYLTAALKNGVVPRPDTSFETWGIKHFGKTLYELCFGRYTERVWGIPPNKLSYKLAQQKLHKLNLKDVIHKLLGGKGEEQNAYFKSYIYPKYGVGEIFERMADDITAAGGAVLLGANATAVELADGRAARVLYTDRESGQSQAIDCDSVISTVPLGSLAKMVQPGLAREDVEAAEALAFRDLILVYFLVNRDYVTRSQWTYLVDDKYVFNRFAEQKNLSPDMLPHDKTVVSFELCCNRGDNLWTMKDAGLIAMALKEVEKLDLFATSEVLDRFVTRVNQAYPIYSIGFDERVRYILKRLSDIPNLFSAGRNGLFLNSDIHDSIEIGLLAADTTRAGTDSSDWYEKMDNYVAEKLEGAE